MSEFDPRREPIRFAPAIATLALTVCAGALIAGSRAEAVTPSKGKAPAAKTDKAGAGEAATAKKSADKPDAVKVAAKGAPKGAKAETAKKDSKAELKAEGKTTAKTDSRTAAKAHAEPVAKAAAAKVEAGYGKPQTIKVKLRKGETLEAAVRRAEASADDAKSAARLVESALGAAPKAGQVFQVEVAPRDGRVGSGRVHKLTLASGADAEPLVLLRGATGKLVADKVPLKLAKVEVKADMAESAKGSKGVKAKELARTAKAKSGKPEAEAADDDAGGVQRVKLVSGEVRGSLYGSARKAGRGRRPDRRDRQGLRRQARLRTRPQGRRPVQGRL
jgi:hypothetical protein